MDRARKQGKRLGRPRKVNGEWDRIGPDVRAGRLTRLEAAHLLGVSDRTVYRLLCLKGVRHDPSGIHENSALYPSDTESSLWQSPTDTWSPSTSPPR